MSRFFHSGLLRLVLILGLVSCGSGLASAQEEDEDEKRPEIKQPSLVELAKLYQELELPMPPKGAKVARFYVGDRYEGKNSGPTRNYSFGLGYQKQSGGKDAWYFWDGLKELEYEPSLLVPWKVYEHPPKPDDLLKSLKLERIKSPPNDYYDNRSELVFCLHCHFLGYGELANFFYWRCKKWGKESLRKTLIFAAWNYWTEELTHPTRDRLVVSMKLKNLVEKHQFFQLTEGFYEDHKVFPNDWTYKLKKAVIDQLDLTLKAEKSKPGTVESLLEELVDCPRRGPDRISYFNLDPESRDGVIWNSNAKIHQRITEGSENKAEEIKKKIYRLGFEAIPVLINHVDDLRLTRRPIRMNEGLCGVPCRCVRSWDFQTLGYEVRIILSAYFDFNLNWSSGEWESKKHHYLDAWNQIKNRDELDFAFQRLVQIKNQNYTEINTYLLTRFPEKIVDFYQRAVQKNPDSTIFWGLIGALVDGKQTKEEKIRLLLLGVNSPNLNLKTEALKGLFQIEPATFDRSYLDYFSKLPKVTEKEESWRTVVQLASLGLSSEDPKVQRKVLEFAKSLPTVAKIHWLERLTGYNRYLNKKATLLFFQDLLIDKAEIDFKEKEDELNLFAYQDSKTIPFRNIVAYQYLEIMGIGLSLEEKKERFEWKHIRNFVSNEITRQLEREGVK